MILPFKLTDETSAQIVVLPPALGFGLEVTLNVILLEAGTHVPLFPVDVNVNLKLELAKSAAEGV